MIKKINFYDRARFCLNPTARRLCEIMALKRSNLCLAADLTSGEKLLDLADKVGSNICLLKTHVDILSDFNTSFIKQLKAVAKKNDFLVFEDRKFADIGNTVKEQYANGLYKVSSWADIINAHTVSGPGVIEGLQTVGLSKKRGLLLVAEMSANGALAHGDYTTASVTMARNYPEFVIGFIAQRQLIENPGVIHITPGVQWYSVGDQLSQRYISPERAIIENRTDVIIVGRGIYQAKDPRAEAALYQQSAWSAYLACC